MILVDMSNLAIGAIQEVASGGSSLSLDESSIRHIIIKRIYDLWKRIGRHHEVVLCYDSKNYWRKDFYPCYKGSRKRKDSSFSWDDFYRLYNEFKVEFPLYFKFRSVEVSRVEGDDIINCIVDYEFERDPNQHIVILSSDTDDLQILERHANKNIQQFSLKTKKYITCEQYSYTLKDHIIEGDSADSIANVLSDADTHVNPDKRSKALTKKMRMELNLGIDSKYMDRYLQNKTVIDMSQIPDEYRAAIIEEYKKELPERIGNPFQYCIKYKLNLLLKHLT